MAPPKQAWEKGEGGDGRLEEKGEGKKWKGKSLYVSLSAYICDRLEYFLCIYGKAKSL